MPRELPNEPMQMAPLSRTFSFIIARRWYVLACYALLLLPSVYFATRVRQDNSLDRLITATDPDYIATRDFERVFGAGEFALLLVEADDPLSATVIGWLDRIERALRTVPHVTANSALSVFRRARAGFEPTAAQTAGFRQFVMGTDLFRKQGLVGDHSLAIGLVLDVNGSEERERTLAAIDRAIDQSTRRRTIPRDACAESLADRSPRHCGWQERLRRFSGSVTRTGSRSVSMGAWCVNTTRSEAWMIARGVSSGLVTLRLRLAGRRTCRASIVHTVERPAQKAETTPPCRDPFAYPSQPAWL